MSEVIVYGRNPIINFTKAKKILKRLGVSSSQEYKKLYENKKLPKGFPAEPSKFYNKFDQRNKFEDYEQASKIVQDLKIKTSTDYKQLSRQGKLPKSLPKCPHTFYTKKGVWRGWTEFLNSNYIVKQGYTREGIKYVNYSKAKQIVKKLGIESENDYEDRMKNNQLPKFLPRDPRSAYKNFKWMDFLNKKNRKGNFLSFKNARAWARKSGIKSMREWKKRHVKDIPKNIPMHPEIFYKDKFKGYNDFLNTVIGRHLAVDFEWMPFNEARDLIRRKNFKTIFEYRRFLKKHREIKIPVNAQEVYGGYNNEN